MPRCARLRLATRVMSWSNSRIEPAVGRQLAGDEIEQRGLAGAVRPDDQPTLTRLDFQIDVGGDAQAAERFAQALDGKRGHGFGSATGGQPLRTAHRPPRRARQPRHARHQTFRHEDDDGDEDGAEHEIPAHHIGADHVLDDDDERRADDRPEQRPGAAGDHHQQRLRRGRQRQGLRADELVVVDEQDAGDRREQSREHEGAEPDHPDVKAERVHAPRLVAGAGERRAERRAHEDRGGRDRKQQRRSASCRRTRSPR